MSRLKNVSDSEDGKSYRQGYEDGARDAFDHSELDAFYAGVGYGKKLAGDKHIGFKNDMERQRFEEGVQAKDKHFNSYRAEPMGFFERLIDLFSPFNRKKRKAYRKVNKNIIKNINKSSSGKLIRVKRRKALNSGNTKVLNSGNRKALNSSKKLYKTKKSKSNMFKKRWNKSSKK